MNPPYFPFYPADFLTDEVVILMTNQEIGCYVKLLCYCWKEGSIPNNILAIAKLCNEDNSVMEELWDTISQKFVPAENDSSRLINRKLNELRRKQVERKLERSASGKKGMKSRWNVNDKDDNSVNNSVITNSVPSVITVENENDNNNSLRNKKKCDLPTNYSLSPEHIRYALDNKIPEQMIESLFEEFCIYHRKNGSKFVNWYAAWQTWVRNDIKFYPDKYKSTSATQTNPRNQPRYMTSEELLSD